MVPHNDGSYCLRASTLREFMQANVDISKEARVTVYEKAEGSEGTAAKEGNFVHRSRDRDSTLGEGVEVGGRRTARKASSMRSPRRPPPAFTPPAACMHAPQVGGRTAIKKSSIGPHCRIGSNVKLTNCILMDHVVIGDKASLSNTIVCGNAEVREGASLKDSSHLPRPSLSHLPRPSLTFRGPRSHTFRCLLAPSTALSQVREGASLKDVQVAAGATVEANAVHKGEAITAGGEQDMDED